MNKYTQYDSKLQSDTESVILYSPSASISLQFKRSHFGKQYNMIDIHVVFKCQNMQTFVKMISI
jgi:hypothetical protein